MEKAVTAEKKAKESNLDLFDFRGGSTVIMKIGKEHQIVVSKRVVWDNTDGQRGVIQGSYLNFRIQQVNGKGKVIKETQLASGSKNNNMWIGMVLKGREVPQKTEKVLEV